MLPTGHGALARGRASNSSALSQSCGGTASRSVISGTGSHRRGLAHPVLALLAAEASGLLLPDSIFLPANDPRTVLPRNELIGDMDTLIAATALEVNLSVVTNNPIYHGCSQRIGRSQCRTPHWECTGYLLACRRPPQRFSLCVPASDSPQDAALRRIIDPCGELTARRPHSRAHSGDPLWCPLAGRCPGPLTPADHEAPCRPRRPMPWHTSGG
jgi:hypothetical protein